MVAKQRVQVIDRLQLTMHQSRPQIQPPSSNRSLRRGASQQNSRPLPISGFCPAAPRPFLAVTTNYDYGSEPSTTETSGPYSLLVECCHQGCGSRKGGLEHDTSSPRFWFRQHHSDNDQGMFRLLPWRLILG